jgi:hypothetical protein
MKYMRKRARYAWTVYKTDTATAKDLNITSVWKKYRNKKKLVATIIPRNRLSRILKKLQANRQMKPGKPFKRLLDM